MKIFRLLEVLFGFAFFALGIISLYFIDMPIYEEISRQSTAPEGQFWSKGSVLILIFLSLLIACASYFHAHRNSYIALAIVFILGGFFVIANTFSILAGRAADHPWMSISLWFCILATVLLAVANTIMYLRARGNLEQ